MLIKPLVLAPKQWTNTQRGEYFEGLVASIFRRMGYRVTTQVRLTGMEIDLLAEQIDTKEKVYVECKFERNSFPADYISKLIGNAITNDQVTKAYLISTSNPSKDAKGRLIEIEEKNNLIRGNLRFAFVGPDRFTDLYLETHNYPKADARISKSMRDNTFSAATLVITPDESFWIVEQSDTGIPKRAFAVPADPNQVQVVSWESSLKMIGETSEWSGLDIQNGLPDAALSQRKPDDIVVDVITQIPVADRFDDYNPSRPEDFVGREKLQQDMFNYLELVRERKSTRRVLALSGPSGFGKSSIVLKMAERAQNKKNRGRYFIYHIDSRSATSPLFVVEAVRTAMQSAIISGFIDLPDVQVSIDSVTNPFDSDSMRESLKHLSDKRKVIVIFFDQFEELLTKEPLLETFQIMKRIAFQVESLQSNLILGFSWRTGITFSEDHPAYHMWHTLREKRVEFQISFFSNHEAFEMLSILERNLGQKINSSLRTHMLEQAQGFPWLLKKLSIHVYRQLKGGVQQRILLERKLDAAILFRDDTSNLNNMQLACLKYVAENSPVDLVELQESFDPEIIDLLYQSRLLIRSGHKYSVYWDIFREYLISGDVPDIPLTYVPQAQLTTALSVLRFIANEGPVTQTDIEDSYHYTQKTIWNILGDLSAFFLVNRNSDDQYQIVTELSDLDNFEESVAEYVASRLKRHIVLTEFQSVVSAGQSISQSEFESILEDVFPSVSPVSLHIYMNRLVSWLRFCGYLELESLSNLARPAVAGRDKGKVVIRHPKLIDGQAQFFATSSLSRVLKLAVILCTERQLREKDVLSNKLRNAAQDLVALKLARWKQKALTPSGNLLNIDTSGHDQLRMRKECAEVVQKAAVDSKFLAILSGAIKDHDRSSNALAERVANELERDWHSASADRYIKGGLRWLDEFGELQKLGGQLSFLDGFD